MSVQEGVTDGERMEQALALARRAGELGEVPVGALVVLNGRVIGQGHNRCITDRDPSGHAEAVAIRQAAREMENYRLPDAELYVTLEPCCMCAGLIIHARIARVVYAAADPKTGAAGSVFDLLESPLHNHHPEVTGGVGENEASRMLRAFFRGRRKTQKS